MKLSIAIVALMIGYEALAGGVIARIYGEALSPMWQSIAHVTTEMNR